MAVIDACLGCEPEESAAQGPISEDGRYDDGCKPGANEVREAAAFVDEFEDAVGGLNEAAGEADAFRLIGIQDRFRRLVPDHGIQLPGEIDGVADTRIHALAAD